ncbi:MAG: hypothetical protein COV09_00990 [Candidatus Vogelbacteria bacterium CG10_big_fil_rev_8_21_14_0_10_50_13]|uniref:Uncharacterized protein n=1 Tax=Candidatus Vogelbacteria bacterium CG10_big_fil_rev_8_21_14_0_10_50_13 TaxID=1975044 RepID=A0A2H0RHQ6_9BACT|nr:MAG: hypothetical protein COV09_00990 [Candidatus Vogelbacteria bacterium CG10_big_fil_rev_8_21_14_0_10_50_13]
MGPNYPPFKNFEIKYPLSWTYKEFSKNIEGIAFYPKDMPDGGSVGGGMQINAAIVLSPYYHDMTGAITTNSSTHHNFVDESGKIMASANLLDPKYQEEFDEMITHFEFID